MDLTKGLVIGAGGFVGANLRYVVGLWLQSKFKSDFPWHTFLINLTGALAIGVFLEIAIRLNWNLNWRLFIAVGLLGGYTTYSSFAFEAVNLVSYRLMGWAAFYVLGSATLTVAAAWLGRMLARAILGNQADPS